MVMENKRDLSISMARANLILLFISIPIAVLQFVIFVAVCGPDSLQITWNVVVFISVLLLGIVVHELLHGGDARGFQRDALIDGNRHVNIIDCLTSGNPDITFDVSFCYDRPGC